MEIILNDSIIHLGIEIDLESKTLGDVVVINVGSFEASDKARSCTDTDRRGNCCRNGGDIANALRTLPGHKRSVKKKAFLCVGHQCKSKTIRGWRAFAVSQFCQRSGLPQPARLNPFLFKGILFSSGGYSALYGEAMSSALILETVDLPEKSSASLHIFPQHVGAGFQDWLRTTKAVTVSMPVMEIFSFIIVSFPRYPTILRDPNTFQQMVISGSGLAKPVCLNFTAIMVIAISVSGIRLLTAATCCQHFNR
jgi:hypothetical protein